MYSIDATPISSLSTEQMTASRRGWQSGLGRRRPSGRERSAAQQGERRGPPAARIAVVSLHKHLGADEGRVQTPSGAAPAGAARTEPWHSLALQPATRHILRDASSLASPPADPSEGLWRWPASRAPSRRSVVVSSVRQRWAACALPSSLCRATSGAQLAACLPGSLPGSLAQWAGLIASR